MKSPTQTEILVGAQVAGYREASRLLSGRFYLAVPSPSLWPSPSFYQRESLDWKEPKRNWGEGDLLAASDKVWEGREPRPQSGSSSTQLLIDCACLSRCQTLGVQ